VVEVLHPDQRWSDVMDKVENYFSGRRRACLGGRSIRVPNLRVPFSGRGRTVREGQVLTDEEILPGLSLIISDPLSVLKGYAAQDTPVLLVARSWSRQLGRYSKPSSAWFSLEL